MIFALLACAQRRELHTTGRPHRHVRGLVVAVLGPVVICRNGSLRFVTIQSGGLHTAEVRGSSPRSPTTKMLVSLADARADAVSRSCSYTAAVRPMAATSVCHASGPALTLA